MEFISDLYPQEAIKSRVVCPNFGRPAQTSSVTKFKFLQMKNSFSSNANELSAFEY